MTRNEAIENLKEFIDTYITCHGEEDTVTVSIDNVDVEALDMAIKALEQEPCDDAISRQAVLDMLEDINAETEGVGFYYEHYVEYIKKLSSVKQQEKTGHCKNCKYFEYDSVANVDGIPLIVAHEICKRWGDGCKTKEDGYCFLFEPKESEEV